MSIFGNYKAYKTYAPQYKDWKASFDLENAKRQKYLQNNPQELNNEDVQRGRALLRAIDTMDEYSQKRAEDMEVATESVIGIAEYIAIMGGTFLGMALFKTKPIQKLFNKYAKDIAKKQSAPVIGGLIMSGILGTLVSIPLYAWAAKKEIQASKKGRYEAMRKDLKNPANFVVPTQEQEAEISKIAGEMPLEVEKKNVRTNFKDIKALLGDNRGYRTYKAEFEKEVARDIENFDKKLTQDEINNAKKDQQLLTKIVEKLDIASQDYAENTELATSMLTSVIMGLGGLFTLFYNKIASKLNWKSSSLPMIITVVATLGLSIFGASIQKQAARVGRFKAKQELLQNPEEFVYVSDDKVENINDAKVKTKKRPNILKFFIQAAKDNREFNQWKKTQGVKEKNLAKAALQIEYSEEQLKEAKRLQHNTFKTFNKIDENSQKYSESVEALGMSLETPIDFAFTTAGAMLGLKYLNNAVAANTKAAKAAGFMQYMAVVLLSVVPTTIINAIITKNQKKASRVADMMAINELNDYRHFVDYSDKK